MRKGNKPEFIFGEDKQLIGVNLSSDFCSEHEWGIGDIQNELGIKTGKLGIDRYLVRKIIPSKLRWFNKKDSCGFVFNNQSYEDQFRGKGYFDFFINDLVGAWNKRSFGAKVLKQGQNEKHLKEIYQALLDLDCCVLIIGGDNPFGGHGLAIMIASRIPEKVKSSWLEHHKEWKDLDDAWAKESKGLEKKLRKSGKGWYSLGNAIIRKDGKVLSWLNPMEQTKYNCGYFTAEELFLWAENKGPVCEKRS